ncbi:MAG: hypothetical protein KA105_07340 [Caulobacter sp.]|nr:hypothetical protein [Caulobacter sp.]
MGTICYFDETIRDSAGNHDVVLEVGTTGYAGNGPQMYFKWNEDNGVILSHEDAKKLCEAVASIATYFGYDEP